MSNHADIQENLWLAHCHASRATVLIKGGEDAIEQACMAMHFATKSGDKKAAAIALRACRGKGWAWAAEELKVLRNALGHQGRKA